MEMYDATLMVECTHCCAKIVVGRIKGMGYTWWCGSCQRTEALASYYRAVLCHEVAWEIGLSFRNAVHLVKEYFKENEQEQYDPEAEAAEMDSLREAERRNEIALYGGDYDPEAQDELRRHDEWMGFMGFELDEDGCPTDQPLAKPPACDPFDDVPF